MTRILPVALFLFATPVPAWAYYVRQSLGQYLVDIAARAVIYDAIWHFMRHMSDGEVLLLCVLVVAGLWSFFRRRTW